MRLRVGVVLWSDRHTDAERIAPVTIFSRIGANKRRPGNRMDIGWPSSLLKFDIYLGKELFWGY